LAIERESGVPEGDVAEGSDEVSDRAASSAGKDSAEDPPAKDGGLADEGLAAAASGPQTGSQDAAPNDGLPKDTVPKERSSEPERPGAQPPGPPNAGPPAKLSWLSRAHAWFEFRYGLDLRSLALFRLAVGYMLLYDLFSRSLDLRAHYTDVGILTRERLVGGWGQKLFYSLHTFGGDTTSQAVLFSVAAVFAAMFFVGYRTRLAAIVSWVLLCSVQGRNYIVLQGGDDMLRVMLFWGMFTPLGARFSVDAILAQRSWVKQSLAYAPNAPVPERRLPKRVLSLATTVLVLQLLTVYFVSAALKTGPTWHQDGSAIHLALHHHAFVTRIGRLVAQLPTHILQGMTWQVWWLELMGPLLFFVPWGTFWWRTVQAALFISFHFGLFLTMELGHFPWVAMGCWLVVLPSWFWDRPLLAATNKLNVRQRLRNLSKWLQGLVVRNEPWLGEPFRMPRVQASLVGSLVLLVFASYAGYGASYAMQHRGQVNGERFEPLLMLRLHANWGMFAPNPPNTSGWLVSVAKQKNGNEIDVWNDGQPVTFDEPDLPNTTYRRERWRKFGDNILSGGHAAIRGYFLRWLCLDWNEDHPGAEAIEEITLFHIAQTANWPGKGYGPVSKNQLAKETCPPPPGEEAKQKPEDSKQKSTPQEGGEPNKAKKASPNPSDRSRRVPRKPVPHRSSAAEPLGGTTGHD